MVLELRNSLWQVVVIFPIYVLSFFTVKIRKVEFSFIILDGIRAKFGFLGFQFFFSSLHHWLVKNLQKSVF